jgi:S1-C subfamily serine protease
MTRTRFFTMAAVLLAMHVLCGVARAQAFLPEDNLAYPVQIVVTGGGGTGFFVRKNRDVFLVTARHVLFDQRTGQLHSHEATLRALSKDPQETAVTVIRVNAAQLQEATEIRTDELRDVAVARIATLARDGLNTTAGVVFVEKSKGAMIVAPFAYLARYDGVNISSQIFMFGYPSIGLSDAPQIDNARPLVRGGIVAGLNAALKTIIIDAPVNHGNSGGPVVQLSATNKLRIIGIATQYVPVSEDVLPLSPQDAPDSGPPASPARVTLGNSGYGVVASADSIIDLISSF